MTRKHEATAAAPRPLSKRAKAFLKMNTNGDEVFFETQTNHLDRDLAICRELGKKGYISNDERRDTGTCFAFRLLKPW